MFESLPSSTTYHCWPKSVPVDTRLGRRLAVDRNCPEETEVSRSPRDYWYTGNLIYIDRQFLAKRKAYIFLGFFHGNIPW
jgi:hypothetical protein